MDNLSTIQQVTVWALPVLLAITLHEAAHALVAAWCGDFTAKRLGRLSLNPIRHIDWFGTLLLPLLIGVLSQFRFVFGYAKPVPVNWNNLRRPRLDMALVTLAGPVSNILMALGWAGLFKLALPFDSSQSYFILFMKQTSKAGILVNLILALLNLLPIPPLDGSRVVASLLPPRLSYQYLRIEPFGFMILILLLVSGLLSLILTPMVFKSWQVLQWLFNL